MDLTPKTVENDPNLHILLRRGLARLIILAPWTNDRVERAKRVVIDRLGVEADMVVVRTECDKLAFELRIATGKDRDDIATRSRNVIPS